MSASKKINTMPQGGQPMAPKAPANPLLNTQIKSAQSPAYLDGSPEPIDATGMPYTASTNKPGRFAGQKMGTMVNGACQCP